MKLFVTSLCLFLAFTSSGYSQALVSLLPISVDVRDDASLQRGARIFMNYCSGCHSLRYLRYNRMALDLGLTTFDGQVDEALLVNNLIFTAAKPQDPIQISLPEADARQWFGKQPPDLSLSAREHGAPWIYTYLKTFYADAKRPFGANNQLVPDVAMPNILAPLQGRVIATHTNTSPQDMQLVLTQAGELNPQEFDKLLQDLVNFLVYVSEPNQLIRYRIGTGVILFLCILLVLVFKLKKLYWKNVK